MADFYIAVDVHSVFKPAIFPFDNPEGKIVERSLSPLTPRALFIIKMLKVNYSDYL